MVFIAFNDMESIHVLRIGEFKTVRNTYLQKKYNLNF